MNQACYYNNGESFNFTSTIPSNQSSDKFFPFFLQLKCASNFQEKPQLKMLISYADKSFKGTIVNRTFCFINRESPDFTSPLHSPFYLTLIDLDVLNVFLFFSIKVTAKTIPKQTWINLNLNRIMTTSSF